MSKNKIKNWYVNMYDDYDKLIECYAIYNRTEEEAIKEAKSEPLVMNSDSFQLEEIKDGRIYPNRFGIHGDKKE